MKKFSHILAIVLLSILVFITKLLYPGLIMFGVFTLLLRMELISEELFLIGFISSTVAFALVSTIIEMVKNISEKKYKFINWLSMNSSRLSIFLMLVSLGIFSMQNEIIWTLDDIKYLLSLEWSIYGISVTIFLVWNVIIVDFLKKRKPQIPKGSTPGYALRYIGEKGFFYEFASSFFSSVSFLYANTLLLVMASCATFIPGQKESLFSQNMVIFSLYMCTNTLVALLGDVMHPLKEEKEHLLRGTKITANEVDLQNRIELQSTKTSLLLDEVEKMDSIDESQKQIIRKGILANFQKTVERDLSMSQNE